MTERMVEANGVELCTEPFGDPADPPTLLIMGLGASMLWWEDGFCRLLADGGRFVIRYDHRDTGRSVTSERGRPRYSGADLAADACGVLDAYGIPAAHLVAVSAGGALAQRVALDHPARVARLVRSARPPRCRVTARCRPRTTRSGGSHRPPPSTGRTASRSSTTSSATRACSRDRTVRSSRRRCGASCAATSSAPATSRPSRTTTWCPRASP